MTPTTPGPTRKQATPAGPTPTGPSPTDPSPADPVVLDAWVDSIGVVGPGFSDWPTLRGILRGEHARGDGPTRVTLPPVLPPAERRRTGVAVKAAIAAGHEAGGRSSFPLAGLASVFSSSGGDGDNCDAICKALATPDRLISPTRFHNSVHNAPSGYWSIATTATAASTSLCAHDGSFCAGLLEAAVQLADSGEPIILVTYDAPYPDPLRDARPIGDAFGLAMVLAPGRTDASLGRLSITLCNERADRLADPMLEVLRTSIPTARALPLLTALARGAACRVVLDYLDPIGDSAGANDSDSDSDGDGDPDSTAPVRDGAEDFNPALEYTLRVAVSVTPC